MLQSLMIVELVSRTQYQITQVTWISEIIRIVLRLHMVPCTGDHTVRESVTQGAVELMVIWVLSYKLEEFTWVLKLAA